MDSWEKEMSSITEVHINPSAFKAVIDKIITDNRITSQFTKKTKFIPNPKVPEGLVIFLDSSREIHSTFALMEDTIEEVDNNLGSLELVQ